MLKVLELYLTDTPSKINKDLTGFIYRNISSIIKKAIMKLNISIVPRNRVAVLQKRGIKKLPTLVYHDRYIVGINDIVEFLRRSIKTSTKEVKPITEDELFEDYNKSVLGISYNSEGKLLVNYDNDDRNEEDKIEADISRRVAEEAERRRSGNNSFLKNSGKPARYAERELNNAADFNDMNNATITRINNVSEPIQALHNVKQSNDPRDDMMLETMLNNMGYE